MSKQIALRKWEIKTPTSIKVSPGFRQQVFSTSFLLTIPFRKNSENSQVKPRLQARCRKCKSDPLGFNTIDLRACTTGQKSWPLSWRLFIYNYSTIYIYIYIRRVPHWGNGPEVGDGLYIMSATKYIRRVPLWGTKTLRRTDQPGNKGVAVKFNSNGPASPKV